MSALTQSNPIDLTLGGATPSIEALKALIKIIENYEKLVAEGLTTTALAGGGDEIVAIESGSHPYALHKWEFQALTDFDAQVYVANFIETVAVVEDFA